MAVEKDTDLFARVEDGKVVEFPVYRIHIRNRNHPFHWYTPVVDAVKPDLPPYHKYERTLVVEDLRVLAVYTAVPFTLAEMLATIRPRTSGLPGEEPAPLPAIADLDPAVVSHIYTLVSNHAHAKLNDFAKSRGYDTLENLISYRGDPLIQLAAEAERGFQLRSQTWAALIAYFNQVTAGTLPVPTSVSEIEALMPALTWE